MNKLLLPAGLAALALAGCAGMDGGSMSSSSAAASSGSSAMAGAGPSMPMAGPMAPMDYVLAAGQSDSFEIQSSQLARSQSRNARVQGFAGMMLRDHQTTTATLMQAALRSGLTPPPSPAPLRPDQQQMMTDLQNAGPNFDRVYMQQQVMAHQQALALHTGYAANGSDPNLRRAAQSAAPIVRHHLDDAQSIVAAMG